MPIVSASPLDSWLLSAFPGFPRINPHAALPKYVCFASDFRRVPLANSYSPPETLSRLSRSSTFLRSSISGGDGALDADDSDTTSSSSSGSSSSDESDSSSDYSFVPTSRLGSTPDKKGKDNKKSPAQSALERAIAYKKSKGALSGPQSPSKGFASPLAPLRPEKPPQVEIVAGKPFQVPQKGSNSSVSSPVESKNAPPGVQVSPPSSVEGGSSKEETEDLGESLAQLEGAEFQIEVPLPSLQESVQAGPKLQSRGTTDGDVTTESMQGMPENIGESESQLEKVISGSTVALSAFQRAKAYKEQQAEMIAAIQEKDTIPPADNPSSQEPGDYLEVEIHTRDGIIKRKTVRPEKAFSRVKETKRTGVSQMDFAGLGFADKKSSNTPAGLMKGLAVDAPKNRPEVEIITRVVENTESQGDNSAASLYKPKVSSWGVFPRPSDISKTYGGGRTIRPGESLETEEEKEIREARTKKLLEDYRRRVGLDIDPQMRAACQEAIKKGERLMEKGSMGEALVVLRDVMDQISFQSDLHGFAALQHAVCLEALGRSMDAKVLYEKLVSHPNYVVRKKAKQLLFGFEAMDSLKVGSKYKWDDGLYKQYFSSFANGYDTSYRPDEEAEDSLLLQTLPYAILLLPVFLIVSLAVLKLR